MADYRQVPLKFSNAGLDLTLPPEGLNPTTWRKLENVRVLKDSVMEGRMHFGNFLTSGIVDFKSYTWTDGISYTVSYPDSYRLGRLVYMAYVGPLANGDPGYLTIHEHEDAQDWERVSAATLDNQAAAFTCFLNGMPIVQWPYNGYILPGEPSGKTRPMPLTCSTYPPSVVRVLSPNGPAQVLIDGRWVITPSLVDPDVMDIDWANPGASYLEYILKRNPAGSPSDGLSRIQPVPAYWVTPETLPYNADTGHGVTTNYLPTTSTTTGGSLTASGTYTYLNTVKNKNTGVRSVASGASAVVTCNATNKSVIVTQYYPVDNQSNQLELWRRGGNIGDSYRLVTTQEIPEFALAFPATLSTVVYTDSSADSSIALNEALDISLVRPFPSLDRAGNSYSLLDYNANVYSVGTAAVSAGSAVVTGNTTSGGTNPTLWTSVHKDLWFRFKNSDSKYRISQVSAATTTTPASLVLVATQADTGSGVYTIERDMPQLRAFGPFLGQYVFWIGDPVRRANFYWNNQGKLSLSSADLNYNTITDPGEELVNGVMFGSTPICFSKRKMYTFDYGGPEATPSFVPREIPMGLGLSAPNGLCATKAGVFFVHTSGIYMTDGQGGPPTLLSKGLQPIFLGESVSDIPVIDWSQPDRIRLVATSRELHFFYEAVHVSQNEVTTQHLVFDLNLLAWTRWKGEFSYVYELEDANAYQLVAGKLDGSVLYTSDETREGGTETISCVARTASWDSGIPLTDKEFGVLMLDYDPDGTAITITPRYNSDTETGASFSTGTPSPSTGRRVTTFSLGDVFKRSISFEFAWTDTSTAHPLLYQAQILFREDEEGIKHWAMPPSSFGIPGWFHIKDGYFSLKSTAAITLTLGVDGRETTYTIPSTGGVRVRNYVEFEARRGKLAYLKMDCDSPFYFYGEDSQIFGKAWKSGTAYQPLTSFQAAGYAQYLRNEGGT